MKKILLSAGLLALCGVVSAQTAITQKPTKETGTYETVILADGETKATLTNDWLYANNEDIANFFSFKTNTVRNIAYANGKVYMAERSTDADNKPLSLWLHIFDAKTGEFLKSSEMKAPIFRKAEDQTQFSHQFPATTLTTDSKGRLVLANLATDFQVGVFEVWVLENEDDVNPVKVMSFTKNLDLPAARMDYINVYGDMKEGKGYIFGAVSNGDAILRWEVIDGVCTIDGDEVSIFDPEMTSNPVGTKIKNFYPVNAAVVNWGTAPFVYPQNAGKVWVDGSNTIPTLYDMTGVIQDGFYDATSQEIFTDVPSGGANGLAEISAGGYEFIVVGRYNHEPKVEVKDRNTLALYVKNETNVNEGVQAVFPSFPLTGMNKNGIKNETSIVLPRVHMVDDNTAEIYLFAQENGFAKFTLTVDDGSSVIETEGNAVKVSFANGVIKASEEVASLDVYTVAGQKVASAKATDEVAAPVAGVYVVTTVDNTGIAATHKVLVK